MDDVHEVHQVVAAVFVRPSGVLLCHRRSDRRWYPDCWDLPGGHIEAGENAQEAVSRECAEELGVVVTDTQPLPFVPTDPSVAMTVLRVINWAGVPSNVATDEHDAIEWVNDVGLRELRLADDRYRELLLPVLDEQIDDR